MGFDPKEKMCRNDRIEKWCLRKAFDTPDDPYLPQEVTLQNLIDTL
jgi:asparagine synthase (glutamine-hydrolysing)